MGKVLQFPYTWFHPTLKEFVVHSSGRRSADADGIILLKGYYRILDNIAEF